MANANVMKLVALADDKGTLFWKAQRNVDRMVASLPRPAKRGRNRNNHLRHHRCSVNGSTLLIPAICVLGLAYAERGSLR